MPNAAWTRLSNPTNGTPGFAVYNYCNTPLVGSQCGYDMFIMSPPDRPDMVVVGGLMHYEELVPYVYQAPQVVGARSNGRAVLMSMDAGATWTDVTGDVGGESMHPDQHALAFVPGAPDKFFVGSDGGIIRTSGEWADASDQCDDRGLADINPGDIPGVQGVAEPDPERVDGHERRAQHAADEQHLGQPVRAEQGRDDRDAGQRHARRSRAATRGSCRSRATAATAVSTQPTRTSASTRTPAVRWT